MYAMTFAYIVFVQVSVCGKREIKAADQKFEQQASGMKWKDKDGKRKKEVESGADGAAV